MADSEEAVVAEDSEDVEAAAVGSEVAEEEDSEDEADAVADSVEEVAVEAEVVAEEGPRSTAILTRISRESSLNFYKNRIDGSCILPCRTTSALLV